MTGPSVRLLSAALRIGLYAVLACSACASLHVPAAAPTIPGNRWISANAGGLSIRVAPLTERMNYWEVFDENLPECGIVALWMEISNGSGVSYGLGEAAWRLRVGNREFRPLNSEEVLQRYYEGRRIRFYSEEGDRKARIDLAERMLPHTVLPPSGKVAGFLFFALDADLASSWDQQATLIARGLPDERAPDGGLRIPLHHATP